MRHFLLGQRVLRLKADNWYMYGVVLVAVSAACFVLAGSAVIGAGGGFIAYRTIAMTIAIACIVSLFAIRYLGESLATATGASSLWTARAGNLAAGGLILASIAAIHYDNHLTMRLSRNERAYHEEMVRQALSAGANTIVLIDPGPFSLPEDHPAIYDQQGRAAPPYEVGCFSGYCVPTDSVFRVVATELGFDAKRLKIWSVKGNDRGQGISCELLASSATYPPGAPERTKRLIDEIRDSRPAACFTYDLRWHDVGIDLAAKPQPVVMLRLAHE